MYILRLMVDEGILTVFSVYTIRLPYLFDDRKNNELLAFNLSPQMAHLIAFVVIMKRQHSTFHSRALSSYKNQERCTKFKEIFNAEFLPEHGHQLIIAIEASIWNVLQDSISQ